MVPALRRCHARFNARCSPCRYLTLRALTGDDADTLNRQHRQSHISLQGAGGGPGGGGGGGTRDHGLAHFATLTEDVNDRHTHFKMHPLIKESEHVPVDAYTRIENAETHEWLHVAELERRGELEELEDGANDGLSYAERMKTIRWDGTAIPAASPIVSPAAKPAFNLGIVLDRGSSSLPLYAALHTPRVLSCPWCPGFRMRIEC